MHGLSRWLADVLVATAFAAATVPPAVSAATPPKPGRDWPQFRGIAANGIAEGHPTATTWSVGDGTNVVWKTAVPGLGLSSPVVQGNLVCLTTATGGKRDAGIKAGLYGDIEPVDDDSAHEWRVLCLDKKDGKVAWERTAHTGIPKIKRHTKSTHANSTLATDGERMIAFFGSEGLYAYDMKGKLLWKKDLGVLDAGFFQVPAAQWETGSSPILHDGVVVVQADVQKGSFVAAFDARDGRELWRTPRADVPTWGTPTVHEVAGQAQVIVNGWKHIGAYDFKTGREIWKLTGLGDIPVPTPVVHDGLIYITNAHGRAGAPVYAIRETAKGDITLAEGSTSNAHIAWSHARDGGYMCTPLVYQGLVYIVKFNGVVTAYDAKTGEKKYQDRFAGGTSAVTASPVAANGKVYFANEDGQVFVVKAGPAFEIVATNDMGSPVLATPAISEGRLLIRTASHLFAIAASGGGAHLAVLLRRVDLASGDCRPFTSCRLELEDDVAHGRTKSRVLSPDPPACGRRSVRPGILADRAARGAPGAGLADGPGVRGLEGRCRSTQTSEICSPPSTPPALDICSSAAMRSPSMRSLASRRIWTSGSTRPLPTVNWCTRLFARSARHWGKRRPPIWRCRSGSCRSASHPIGWTS
jgi:outer membrane protein assembly factor BamB